MSESLLITRDGNIATVALNRPDKLNALERALWAAVGAAFRELARDESLRCVILRGEGRAFGAGADIAEFPKVRASSAQAREYAALMNEAMAAVASCPHPTVAQISGACVGGGLELAICCDLRIAGASAAFGVPIQRIAVTMGVPEISALIDLVGRGHALEILLEGRVFGAADALRMGLVTRVVPDDRVAEEALGSARRIAAGAPLVHRWHKQISRRLAHATPSEAEADEAYQTFDSEDFKEGVAAFLAKRPPAFRGR